MDFWNIAVEVLLLLFVFKCGQWSITLPIKLAVKKIAESRGQTVAEMMGEVLGQREQNTVEPLDNQVAIEYQDGIYYAYTDSGKFLTQALSFELLFNQIKQQFPHSEFRVNKSQAGLSAEQQAEMIRSLYSTYGSNS